MSNMLPEFDTIRFTDVWDNADDFIADYKASGVYELVNSRIADNSANALFYLLYGRYANNPIANFDVTQ